MSEGGGGVFFFSRNLNWVALFLVIPGRYPPDIRGPGQERGEKIKPQPFSFFFFFFSHKHFFCAFMLGNTLGAGCFQITH